MPKDILTQEEIDKIIEESKVNQKWDENDTGEISTRLQRAAEEKLLNERKATKGVQANKYLQRYDGTITVSNKKFIKTDVTLGCNREYYERNSYKSTFDTEINQLVTKAPIVKKVDPPPPPKPSNLTIGCKGWLWELKGKKGRRDKDRAQWKDNYFPGGNNPGGGYLIIPGDHPVFFVRTVEPIDARTSFNYEWKVDGNVVSELPGFNIYNVDNQGKKREHSDSDRDWHTHWKDQDDVIVECRVWNESGEIKAKTKYRSAMDVMHPDHEDDEGRPIPKAHYDGYREFDMNKFLEGKTQPTTSKMFDKKYGIRHFRLKNAIIPDYNTTIYTRPGKYDIQNFQSEQWPDPPGFMDMLTGYGNQNVMDYNSILKEKDAKLKTTIPWRIFDACRPFGIFPSNGGLKTVTSVHPNFSFTGWMTAADASKHSKERRWYSFSHFWSGYDDIENHKNPVNFMKLDENGLPDINGESAMDIKGRWPHTTGQPGDSVYFGMFFGYKCVDNEDRKMFYFYYGEKEVEITEDMPKDNDLQITLHRIELTYHEDPKPSRDPVNKKFTVSGGVERSPSKLWQNTRGRRG